VTTELIHDDALERALIGCALCDSGATLNAVADLLRPAEMHREAHRLIWSAMIALRADGSDVDAVALAAELREMGRFDVVGGAAYLDACIDSVKVTGHPREYARRLRRWAVRRALCEAARRLFVAANDAEADDSAVEAALSSARTAWECGGDELPTLGADEIAALVFPPRSEWLIRDWWSCEGCGFVAAWEKASKTVLALGMALSVVNGKPWLGKWDVTQGPVVFIAEEDHKRRIQRRLARIGQALGLDHRNPALRIAAQEGCNLTSERGRGRLAAAVRRHKPILTVIDPLRRVTPGIDEKDSQAIGELLGWARRLQAEQHTAVMILHHMRKGVAGDQVDASRPSHRLRGTGDMGAWFDDFVHIARKTEVEHVVEGEHRDAARLDKQHIRIAWDDESDGLSIRWTASPVRSTEPRRQFVEETEDRQKGF